MHHKGEWDEEKGLRLRPEELLLIERELEELERLLDGAPDGAGNVDGK